ncbi:hypothetical protein P9112_012839 [Eukaryota sp. TZLM1-RC]
METSAIPPVEQTEEDVVMEVSDESPTPDSIPNVLVPMEQTPAPTQSMVQPVFYKFQPTPSTMISYRSSFSNTSDGNLLLSSMVRSKDRDSRRRDRPNRPTVDAADLRDVD